jgi:hypothetical protein
MKARLVDERDTVWESTTSDFRVFLVGGHSVSAFNLDSVSLAEASAWAGENAPPSVKVSIALREVDAAGQPGLRWLVGQPV